MGRPFTEGDVDLIRTLAEAGWTDAEIGIRIGRSHSVVKKKRQSKGIWHGKRRQCHRYTGEDVDLIRTLAEAGWTDAEIGIRIDRFHWRVAQIRRDNGIRAGLNRRFLAEEVTTIQEMVTKGMSSREIAKHLGRSTNSINTKRFTAGVLAPEMGPQSFRSQALRDEHVAVLLERRAKRRAERAGLTSGVHAS